MWSGRRKGCFDRVDGLWGGYPILVCLLWCLVGFCLKERFWFVILVLCLVGQFVAIGSELVKALIQRNLLPGL